MALEVGRRTGVLVAPVQAFGMAEHHLGFAGTMSLQPATLLGVMHDLVLSLARHGFERVFVVNGHGGNIATSKAAFAQAHATAASRSLAVAPRLRCRLANWFMAGPVMREARELYGSKEGHHATPSEIAVTLAVEPSLLSKQRSFRILHRRDRFTVRRTSAAAIPMDAWDPTLPWRRLSMGRVCSTRLPRR